MNGPVPAEFWLCHDSAVSVVLASGPLVPPWACTVLLSSAAKTPKLPFEMKAGSGADLVIWTVLASGVSTLVIPSSRNDGLPLMPIARSIDHLRRPRSSCCPNSET
jgi:hypothetical protein